MLEYMNEKGNDMDVDYHLYMEHVGDCNNPTHNFEFWCGCSEVNSSHQPELIEFEIIATINHRTRFYTLRAVKNTKTLTVINCADLTLDSFPPCVEKVVFVNCPNADYQHLLDNFEIVSELNESQHHTITLIRK